MPTHNLEDYIVIVENALSCAECDDILSEYSSGSEWLPTEIQNGLDTSVRNADVVYMSSQESMLRNAEKRSALDKIVFSGATKAISKYVAYFPLCDIKTDSGYDLLRYAEGQFYAEHVDHFSLQPRTVSCSFALNDNFSGGEFSFFADKIKYKIPRGAALLFPSNFLYPHQIKPVTQGQRFSIVTWFN